MAPPAAAIAMCRSAHRRAAQATARPAAPAEPSTQSRSPLPHQRTRVGAPSTVTCRPGITVERQTGEIDAEGTCRTLQHVVAGLRTFGIGGWATGRRLASHSAAFQRAGFPSAVLHRPGRDPADPDSRRGEWQVEDVRDARRVGAARHQSVGGDDLGQPRLVEHPRQVGVDHVAGQRAHTGRQVQIGQRPVAILLIRGRCRQPVSTDGTAGTAGTADHRRDQLRRHRRHPTCGNDAARVGNPVQQILRVGARGGRQPRLHPDRPGQLVIQRQWQRVVQPREIASRRATARLAAGGRRSGHSWTTTIRSTSTQQQCRLG